MRNWYYEPPTLMRCESTKEITSERLAYFIDWHRKELPRYSMLENMYKGHHAIVDDQPKASYKPDNRIVVNFAKYIVDNFNGYFMGKTVAVSHPDQDISTRVNMILKLNDQADNDVELSKLVRIYGRAYEFVFQNEFAETSITYNSPLDMFVVYDQSIARRPLFAVRYYVNEENMIEGEIYTRDHILYFLQGKKGYNIYNRTQHYYRDLPIIEYVQNEERQSIFEPVISMINAFDKAISEKANDVDYFADAYLSVLGVKLDDTGLQKIRDNRIINFYGTDDPEQIKRIVVEFLSKPDGDTSQENLLNRLETLIYQMAMVTNITSESLGNASGVGLEFKIQEMENLALTCERKFSSGMNKRFKLIFRLPTNVPTSQADEWVNLEYTFHRNIPRDILSEVNMAQAAAGLLPLEDRIAMVSSVKDPKATAELMRKELEGADVFQPLLRTRRAPLRAEITESGAD